MTREQYEAYSVTALRSMAKERGLRHISALKKSELIDVMMAAETEDQAREVPMTVQTEEIKQEVRQEAPAAPTQPDVEQGHKEMRTERRPIRQPQSSQSDRAPRQGQGAAASRTPGQGQNVQTDRSVRAGLSAQTDRMPRQPQSDRAPRQMQGMGAQQDRTSRPAQGTQNDRMNRAGQAAQTDRTPRQPQSVQGDRTSAPRQASQTQGAQSSERTPRPYQSRNAAESERSDKPPVDLAALDSGETAEGILEIMADGYGFLRSNHYLSGENDIYVAPSQIRRFGLRTGDLVSGNTRIPSSATEKYRALLYLKTINGMKPSEAMKRPAFEQLTPIFPDHRIRLERSEKETAMRIVDLISPVGRGQRGMIVSPPKAGKTTLLKDIARSILRNEPDMHIMIMLIDERPEEVTDIREAIVGDNVEVLYSTFDELPEHHMRVAEMGIERARRLVEYGQHVTILLDSITRLARAYNLIVQPSGRTLSGGLDPAALNMPKRFFGAARNMREGGSLTILATALIDTGSKMDDVVYEEFKGTGNMELVLDRKLSERRVFPAIDIQRSGTRREDLLLDSKEMEAVYIMRKALNGMKGDEAVENILNLFAHTKNNRELTGQICRQRMI